MRMPTRSTRIILLVCLMLALLPLAGAEADLAAHPAPSPAGSGLSASVPNNMTEGFEGAFPSAGWTLWDGDAVDDVIPAARDCQALGSTKSLMMHGGGTVGSVTGCESTYPLDFMCRAWYGPFDLTNASAAQFSFAFTGTIEIQYYGECGDYDYFLYGASTNGWDIDGTCISGEWNTAAPNSWNQRTVDLASYLGESEVWIGFEFRSDYSDVARGIFVDNVSLTTTEAATATPVETTAAPTETATPTEEPTATSTDDPAATATATETDAPTATATDAATPTATETDAATPTATDTPDATVDPYPSPATSTPTATSAAAASLCLPLVVKGSATGVTTELIVNGGFETDDAWVLPATKWTATYATDEARSCARSVLVGITDEGDNTYSYSSAYQWVTIPADAVDAELTFWTYAHSGEPRLVSLSSELKAATTLAELRKGLAQTSAFATSGSDLQYVVLIRQGQAMVKLLSQCDDDTGWTQHTFDVSPFAGETLAVHFEVYNDGGGGVTSMHVDDVSLLVR